MLIYKNPLILDTTPAYKRRFPGLDIFKVPNNKVIAGSVLSATEALNTMTRDERISEILPPGRRIPTDYSHMIADQKGKSDTSL